MYGGSLENRMRFMKMAMNEVMEAAGSDMAVLVKTNMRDGFKGGIELDEGLEIARELERCGAHALVLSGGFVSRAPMYVMRGQMPIKTLTYYMDIPWLKVGAVSYTHLSPVYAVERCTFAFEEIFGHEHVLFMAAFAQRIDRRMFAQQQILLRFPSVSALGGQQVVEKLFLQFPAAGIIHNAQVAANHSLLRRLHGQSSFRKLSRASSAM